MDSDPSSILFSLALILAFVFLNGFFVASEFAMVKIRSSRLNVLVENGNKMARYAQTVVHNLDAYLSACQLGITLASLGLGWIGEPIVSQLLYPIFATFGFSEKVLHTLLLVIGFVFITFIHIVIGEMAPKTIAIRKAEAIILWTSLPMILFHKMVYPFIWILNGTANGLLKLFRFEPASEHDSSHTGEEIQILMKESHENGHIDNEELTLVNNIFTFTETLAIEIMIPRMEMVCLYTHHSLEDNLKIAMESMHTRYPVCDPDKDHIIGFVHIKDILKSRSEAKKIKNIEEIIRPILSVPESMPINKLLKQIQLKKTHLVTLIDEYGGTSGVLTIEDIIEEIIGEVQDEFDTERLAIEQISDKHFNVDGQLSIEEFNDHFGTDLESEHCYTVAGWMYALIEVPPSKGQKVQYGNYIFVVDEVNGHKIERINIEHMEKNMDET